MSRPPRTVLTTGSSSGLGLATVIELARRGHDSVGSVRSAAKAELVAAAAEEAGVAVRTVLLDVDDAKGCADVVDAIRPDALVNNAGFMRFAAVEEVDDAEARRLFETLVVAPIRLARLCLPAMRERGFGRIVQISSISARASFPLMGWYQGCKQALEGISDALRLEVASAGIAVSLIEPGLFESGMSHDLGAEASPESPYAKAYARSARIYGSLGALMTDAATVARVIADAIESRSPSARYPVGMDAQFNVLSDPVTPTALRDRAIRAFFGL